MNEQNPSSSFIEQLQPTNPVATSNIQKLDGSNYLAWKRQVLMVLELRGLKECLTCESVTRRTDLQACLVLLETMNKEHQNLVQSEPNAKCMFEVLEREYADKTEANKHKLLSEYFRFKKKHEDSVITHVTKLKSMRAELVNLNENQTDALFQVNLLHSMGNEYEDVRKAWDITHPSMKTNEFLISMLKKKENELKTGPMTSHDLDAEQMMLMKRNHEKSIEELKKTSRCGKCGRLGHWYKDPICPMNQGPKHQNIVSDLMMIEQNEQREEPSDEEIEYVGIHNDQVPSSSHQDQIGFIETIEPTTTEDCMTVTETTRQLDMRKSWIVDSGATCHMCSNEKWFHEITQFEKPKSCAVGNGHLMDILGKGSVNILSVVNGKKIKIKLTNVNYIPGLTTNIISVSAFDEKGWTTSFNKNVCRIVVKNRTIMVGHRAFGRLYKLDVETVTNNESTYVLNEKRRLDEWHQALGHANIDTIKRALSNHGIAPVEGPSPACNSCPAGKGHQSSHPGGQARMREVGQLCHIDLSGRVNKPSINGYFYYMICKDDASEYVHCAFLKTKDETPSLVQRYIIDFENECGHPIKSIRSDNGSEFVNNRMKQILLKERICTDYSTPYTPQQNGVIERTMRTIAETARTILLDSTLPSSLWPEAIENAIYVRNRLPTSRSNLSPYERFIGRKPELRHILRFGEQVHTLDKSNNLEKFQSRTIEAYIVGHTKRSNSYRIYIPSTGKLGHTCDLYIAPHRAINDTNNEREHTENVATVPISYDEIIKKKNQNQHQYDVSRQSPFDCGYSSHIYQNLSPEGEIEILRRHPSKNILDQMKRLDDYFWKYNVEGYRPALDSSELSSNISTDPMPITQTGEDSETGLKPSTTATNARSDNFLTPSAPIDNDHLHHLYGTDDNSIEIPKCYHDAVSGKDRDLWLPAIRAELSSHEKNHTWERVPRPIEKRPLTTKWVFSLKRDAQGLIVKRKARLVVRGFEQIEGVDHLDTFAPVAGMNTIRYLFAICAIKKLKINQFDVSSAFLNGTIDEIVYIETPQGVKTDKGQCLKLNKALYGLKQAPRAWFRTLSESMRTMCFEAVLTEPCLFFRKKPFGIVGIYVDDGLLLTETDQEAEQTLASLGKLFDIRRITDGMFLNMQFEVTDKAITIHQGRYLKDVLERFKMSNCAPKSTPIVDTSSLYEEPSENTDKPYRQALGALQYIANCTRPDILFATNLLGRFSNKPGNQHWEAILNVMRYLKSTQDIGISYGHETQPTTSAYSDADWGNDLTERASTSGGIVLIAGGPVAWLSRRQKLTAQSTAEAEYIAANEVVNILKWLNSLDNELGLYIFRPTLKIDNQSTISQIKNTTTLRASKHIEIKYHSIRQAYENKIFELKHVPSSDQLADTLTKPNTGKNMALFRQRIGLIPILSLLSIVLLGSSTGLDAGFTKSSRVTWHDTDYYVDQGTEFFEINYLNRSPCSIIKPLRLNSSVHDHHKFGKHSVQRLEDICQIEYEEKISPALEMFANCESLRAKDWSSHIHDRFKRWIVWFVLAAISIAFVVSSLGHQTILANRRFTEMNHTLSDVTQVVEGLRNSLETQVNITADSITTMEQQFNRVNNLTQSLIQFASKTAEVSWTSAKAYMELEEEVRALHVLKEKCILGRIATSELARITGISKLRQLHSELTQLYTMDEIGFNAFRLQSTHPVIAKDTHVFKVAPFQHWVNITEDAVLVRYTGPTYVIHNSTSNCTKGIEEPNSRGVVESCTMGNYSDTRLQDWTPQLDSEYVPAVQIHRIKGESHVYCFMNNITISGQVKPCPSYPFKIPITESFETAHVDSQVLVFKSNSTRTISPVRSIHLNSSMLDTDDTEVITLLSNLKKKAIQLKKTLAERNDPTSYLSEPTFWYLNSLPMGIIAMLITSLIYLSVKRKGKITHQTENITVVNNPTVSPSQITGPRMSRERINHHIDTENRETQNIQLMERLPPLPPRPAAICETPERYYPGPPSYD